MFHLKFSKTMKDIQWSFISLATASFAHLLLRIVLGRELGPSGLGLYTLVFTIYMFGMQFAAFGIGAALTKYIAQYHDDQTKIQKFVTSGVVGSLFSGSVIGILLYLFSGTISIQFFHVPEMTGFLRITAFCFPFIALQKAVIGALNGLRKMKLFAVINIVQNVAVLMITVILVLWLEMGVSGAILGFILPTISIGLISLVVVKDYFTTSLELMNTILKEISWFGFYVVLSNSIGMVNTQIDSLLIGRFMSEIEVGYYAVAIMFMQGIGLLPQAIQRVTTPTIATYYGKKEFEKIRSLIKITVIKIFVITLCMSAFLAISGKFLIAIIFTEEFLPSYTPMLILLVGYTIYSAFVSIGACFASVGKVQIAFRINLLCAILNILLNIILIPKFGLVGAASATSISLIFTMAINLRFIYKYFKHPCAINLSI